MAGSTLSFSQTLRRRRSKSLSKAENIVTKREKFRRAQPDHPLHVPQDSLLSWQMSFDNFDGVVNWAFLLLLLGGARLALENFNKYGILVDPLSWILYLPEAGTRTTLFSILFLNVHVLTALTIEKLDAKGWISRKICRIVHVTNLALVLTLPVYVIGVVQHSVSVGMEWIFFIIAIGYIILFMKLFSFMDTLEWLKQDYDNRKNNRLAKRQRSMQYFRPVLETLNDDGSEGSQLDTRTQARDEHDKGRSKPMREEESSDSDWTPTVVVTEELIKYPDNLTIQNIYYFWLAPTLCYEMNFPRSSRTRKTFLLVRFLEVIIGSNIILALIQQWLIPGVVNSLLPFTNLDIKLATERILKLAVPNHLIWLTMFYIVFHSFLNTIAELMHFADRGFYSDWWNAKNVAEFWKKWNLPVHKWCVRHLYRPLMQKRKVMSFQAMVVTFFVSAVFHEYMISVPLRMFKAYAFLSMIGQIPLLYLSVFVSEKISPRIGNMVIWLSLFLGQPMAVMMYYHDFVMENYKEDLIQNFLRLQ